LDKEVDFLVWELRPTALDDLGLQMALTNYAQTWSKHYGIPVQLHTSGLENKRLTFEIETALYRIAQEALNNIAKHAKASTVNILLEGRQGAVSLILEDDGQGFEETTLTDASDRGLGLAGMRERATLLGGSFEIESQPGQGTTVLVQIPVTPTVPEANYLKGETDE
jgi:signal transduction histidine kinase